MGIRVLHPRLARLARSMLTVAAVSAACGAVAQTPPTTSPSPDPASGTPTGGPIPYSELQSGPVAASDAAQTLHQALEAARKGDADQARSLSSGLADPVARKLVTWALIDNAGSMLNFFELDAARRDLWGWPRPARRQAAAEKALEGAALAPQRVVDWFQGKDPETAEGAMALASAYQALGRPGDAQALIRRWWRDTPFEAEVQARMLGRFGAMLSSDDNVARLDTLLMGAQGPAVRALLELVDADHRALAEARMALRSERSNALALADQVPASLQNDPGLAYERARYLHKRGQDGEALSYVRNFPTALPSKPEIATAVWNLRRVLMNSALKGGDYESAYAAATRHGLPPGTADCAEAEFFAGWIALDKLHDPVRADSHFEKLHRSGASPITLSRALYWRGRVAEARNDAVAAAVFYGEGAQYYTTFYGQLAAQRAGQTTLTLGRDPVPTAEDRERFNGRELVHAARLLLDAGERPMFRAVVLTLDDVMPNAEELALLVDFAKMSGDQDLAMRVVRAGAIRGFILPERGYPLLSVPEMPGAAEPAFSLGIARQESNFDPRARSAFARGIMQLRPSTAAIVARRIGLPYSAARLEDAEYNMRLGSSFLGQLVDQMGGSYLMAAAAYNAGPGRPPAWSESCGDPRGGSTDPVDYIECIPFSETRNYVMRTLEAMQVYRARLGGGRAPLTLLRDLKRGAWTPAPPATTVASEAAATGSR